MYILHDFELDNKTMQQIKPGSLITIKQAPD